MNNWIKSIAACVLMCICSVAQEVDIKTLSMTVKAKEQYLVQLPVVCKVTISNEVSQACEVYLPSQKANTLRAELRRIGASNVLERTAFVSYIGHKPNYISLPAEQSIDASINISEMFSSSIPVGRYECRITYCFDNDADDRIQEWSRRFSIVEPTMKKDKLAREKLLEIKALLLENRLKLALKRLSAIESKADSSEYLSQARFDVAMHCSEREMWLEAANQLEKLREDLPEWACAIEVTCRLGVAYCEAGRYDDGISLLSSIAEKSVLARGYLEKAKDILTVDPVDK